MSSAPIWISSAAATISAASFAVSVMAFRAGGPRLRLVSLPPGSVQGGPFPDGVPVGLVVANYGRAAVNVESFFVTWLGSRTPLAVVGNIDGPALPFRLDAHASQSWTVDALPLALELDRQSGSDDPVMGPPSFRFAVSAGNGKTARDPRSHTAVRIIASARRDN